MWWKSFPQHSPVSSSVSVCLITVGFVLLSASHYVTVNERFIILISHVSPNSLFPMGTINNSVIAGKKHFKPFIPELLNNVTLRKVILSHLALRIRGRVPSEIYVPLQDIYSEINHRNNPSFTSYSLWIWWKKTQWSDMSNYSSFQNVHALLNVWYLWTVINMMMMMIIIIIIYSRQWYGVIDAQPVN